MKVVEEVMMERFGLNIGKYAFGNRVIDNWNWQIVFIVKLKLLILVRSIFCLHWNRELYSLEVCRYDSGQYTAKACAY